MEVPPSVKFSEARAARIPAANSYGLGVSSLAWIPIIIPGQSALPPPLRRGGVAWEHLRTRNDPRRDAARVRGSDKKDRVSNMQFKGDERRASGLFAITNSVRQTFRMGI